MNIIYAGNISNDRIKIRDGEEFVSIGGSAIYSAFSTKFIDSTYEVGIIGNTIEENVKYIKENNITFIGNIIKRSLKFDIDELNGTCIGENYNIVSNPRNRKIVTEHLHVSFRKGIDIKNIIETISFKTLSVDVMIHSVDKMIHYIKKYENKIDILFCNMSEFLKIKEIIKKIPLIVITNSKYPLLIKENNNIYTMNIKKSKKLLSDTGAGDSFIGGFLSKYLKEKNLLEATNYGVYAATLSIEEIGPLRIKKKKKKFKMKRMMKLPNNLIVIGNSCAGKSTFVRIFEKYYNLYINIDDYGPLLEIFKLDDKIRQDKTIVLNKEIEKNINYCSEIIEEYRRDYPDIKYYTKISENLKGHEILRPILWDLILEYSLKKEKEGNKIIQFARGKDKLYESEFGRDVYKRSITKIYENIENAQETIIVNLIAPLENRINRNLERERKGGHYVSESTIKQIYDKDYFISENYKGYNVIKIKDKKVLVINILNNQLKEEEIEKNIYLKIERILKKYNKFMEEEYGFE